MTRVDRFKVMTLRLGFRREGFGLGYVWRCLDGRVGGLDFRGQTLD